MNVERVLKERNEALLAAEKLRNDFVHHVSYELRSPLTNIIGFIQLLGDGAVGSLNPKQVEYAGYVTKSSAALLAIINDILDLATIDMDAMELNLGAVDIVQTMEEAAEGVQDRLAENDIRLRIVALDGIGSFPADGKRLRQILFNLLSNAIGFSTPGQTVTLAALRRDDTIVFKVSDQGRGIPLDVLDRCVRPVPVGCRRLAPPRRGPGAVDREVAGGAARGPGADRLGARRGHGGDLHLPRRARVGGGAITAAGVIRVTGCSAQVGVKGRASSASSTTLRVVPLLRSTAEDQAAAVVDRCPSAERRGGESPAEGWTRRTGRDRADEAELVRPDLGGLRRSPGHSPPFLHDPLPILPARGREGRAGWSQADGRRGRVPEER